MMAAVPSGDLPPGLSRKGRDMHGFIGFSTIVYAVIGLAAIAGGAVARLRRHK
jgi:hypothetical protein